MNIASSKSALPGAGLSRWASPVFACSVMIVGLVLSVVTGTNATQAAWPWQPEEWDPRVTELAAFVETTRGLRFEHPIDIVFVHRRDVYTAYQQRQDAFFAQFSEPEAVEWPGNGEIDRAFGRLEGPAVPFEAAMGTLPPDDRVEGPIAVFDPYLDFTYIPFSGGPNDPLPVEVQALVVHELTHALSQQHFPEFRFGQARGAIVSAALLIRPRRLVHRNDEGLGRPG